MVPCSHAMSEGAPCMYDCTQGPVWHRSHCIMIRVGPLALPTQL